MARSKVDKSNVSIRLNNSTIENIKCDAAEGEPVATFLAAVVEENWGSDD